MTPFSKVCVGLICFILIHGAEAVIENFDVKLDETGKVIACKEVAEMSANEGDTIRFISAFSWTLNWVNISLTKKSGNSQSLLPKKGWNKLDKTNGEVIFALENVSVNYSGEWSFEFLTYKSHIPQREPIRYHEKFNYTLASCNIKVKIKLQVPEPPWVYISVGIGILVIIVILAQTAVIIYLKKKEKLLLRSANFKPGNKIGADGVRYSLTPGQRTSKNRRGDSGIYETLEDIKLQNCAAPVPPAIDTLPRKGGSNKLEKRPLLPTIPSSPEDDHNITLDVSRLEAERIKARPQYPLPCEETYEEVENKEDNTYEPPPMIPPVGHIRARPAVANKLPATFPIPHTLPGQQVERPSPKATRPELPVKAEKPKPAKASKPEKPPKIEKPAKAKKPPKIEKPAKAEKPPKAEKPAKPVRPEKHAVKPIKSDPNSSVASELDSILKKRRNDTNPPVMVNELGSILKKRREAANKPAGMEPAASAPLAAAPSLPRIPPKSPVIARSTASNTSTQTRKPPAPLPVSKPPCPLPDPEPVPLPVVSHNDEPNSSDEEWTYEALPQYNIYSI